MKNTLTDLNNHLFAQIERLSDEELTGEELVQEIERAKSVSGISQQIIANGKLALDAEEFKAEYAYGKARVPKFLENKNE